MNCVTRNSGIAVFLLLACQQLAYGQTGDAEDLSQLIDEVWQFDLKESPLFATRVGVRRYNDQLGHQAVADHKRRILAKREFDNRLRKIDRSKLKRPDQINYDVFARLLHDELAEATFQAYLIPITNRSGFHISFPQLAKRVPLNSVQDYENYIARLNAFERYAEDHIGLMRVGIKEGIVLPAVVLEGYQESIVTHIVKDPRRSLLFAPFTHMPDKISQVDQQRLAAAGRQAISSSVVVGYRKFLDFMKQEYVPACRGSIGAAALPNGRAFYRHRVRRFTTLDVTPAQVHETGHAEVARIRAALEDDPSLPRLQGLHGHRSIIVGFDARQSDVEEEMLAAGKHMGVPVGDLAPRDVQRGHDYSLATVLGNPRDTGTQRRREVNVAIRAPTPTAIECRTQFHGSPTNGAHFL